jgi:uncharacterized protein DUF397
MVTPAVESRSGQNRSNGDCVEVAFHGQAVLVRDSKNAAGGQLAYPVPGWRHFGCPDVELACWGVELAGLGHHLLPPRWTSLSLGRTSTM